MIQMGFVHFEEVYTFGMVQTETSRTKISKLMALSACSTVSGVKNTDGNYARTANSPISVNFITTETLKKLPKPMAFTFYAAPL